MTIGSPVNEKKKVKEGDTLFQISGMFGFLIDDFVVISKDTGDSFRPFITDRQRHCFGTVSQCECVWCDIRDICC